MGHDWAVLAAIVGISTLAGLSVLSGTGDGVLAAAFTALAGLGTAKIALREALKRPPDGNS